MKVEVTKLLPAVHAFADSCCFSKHLLLAVPGTWDVTQETCVIKCDFRKKLGDSVPVCHIKIMFINPSGSGSSNWDRPRDWESDPKAA